MEPMLIKLLFFAVIVYFSYEYYWDVCKYTGYFHGITLVGGFRIGYWFDDGYLFGGERKRRENYRTCQRIKMQVLRKEQKDL